MLEGEKNLANKSVHFETAAFPGLARDRSRKMRGRPKSGHKPLHNKPIRGRPGPLCGSTPGQNRGTHSPILGRASDGPNTRNRTTDLWPFALHHQ